MDPVPKKHTPKRSSKNFLKRKYTYSTISGNNDGSGPSQRILQSRNHLNLENIKPENINDYGNYDELTNVDHEWNPDDVINPRDPFNPVGPFVDQPYINQPRIHVLQPPREERTIHGTAINTNPVGEIPPVGDTSVPETIANLETAMQQLDSDTWPANVYEMPGMDDARDAARLAMNLLSVANVGNGLRFAMNMTGETIHLAVRLAQLVQYYVSIVASYHYQSEITARIEELSNDESDDEFFSAEEGTDEDVPPTPRRRRPRYDDFGFRAPGSDTDDDDPPPPPPPSGGRITRIQVEEDSDDEEQQQQPDLEHLQNLAHEAQEGLRATMEILQSPVKSDVVSSVGTNNQLSNATNGSKVGIDQGTSFHSGGLVPRRAPDAKVTALKQRLDGIINESQAQTARIEEQMALAAAIRRDHLGPRDTRPTTADFTIGVRQIDPNRTITPSAPPYPQNGLDELSKNDYEEATPLPLTYQGFIKPPGPGRPRKPKTPHNAPEKKRKPSGHAPVNPKNPVKLSNNR